MCNFEVYFSHSILPELDQKVKVKLNYGIQNKLPYMYYDR